MSIGLVSNNVIDPILEFMFLFQGLDLLPGGDFIDIVVGNIPFGPGDIDNLFNNLGFDHWGQPAL